MIKIELLAKDLQNKLEDISYELYGQDAQGNDTDNYPLFNITEDMQIYQNRGLTKDGRKFTPGILRLVPSVAAPTTQWGVYTSYYELELYGYRDERKLIREIFREFTKEYNGNQYTPEQGYDIFNDKIAIALINELTVVDFTLSDDGLDIPGFVGTVGMVFSIFVGGLSAKETTLKIDDIPIPFDEISYNHEKSMVANIEYKDSSDTLLNKDSKLVVETLAFSIPFNVSEEVDQLILNRLLEPTYNDVFEIEWNLSIGTKKDDYFLRSAIIQYNQQNEAIGIALGFESAQETTTIQIDGEDIPVLKFSFAGTRETKPFNSMNDTNDIEIKQIPTNYTYGIGMIVLFDETNEVIKQLFTEITTNAPKVSHELIVDGVDEGQLIYEVILVDGTWEFDERANQTLALSFVGEFKE